MNETISNSPHQWNTQELPVVVIAGYGPSIGESTARQFGSKGYAIACLGRTQNKLLDSVQELKASKITAAAFVTDCGDTRSVKEAIQQVQSHLGRISVIVWNAASYVGSDLVTGNDDPSEILNQIVGVGCAGLLASIQEAYEDLKAMKGTILITGGGLSGYDQNVNQIAVNNSWMGLAFCKSSQRKLAGLLHARLKPDGVMVGTVIISGAVRVGGGLDVTDPDDVATAFWEIHHSRHKQEVHLGSLTQLASEPT